jgi:hypothetical protein
MPNPTHYAVLLVSASPINPDGLPANWHMDARVSGPVLDPNLAALGYTLLTAAEFDQRQITFGPEYQLYLATIRTNKDLSDKNKLDALKKLFDDGDVIEAIWPTATNAQQKELAVISYRLLRKMKQMLLDNYKP